MTKFRILRLRLVLRLMRWLMKVIRTNALWLQREAALLELER